MTQPTLLDIPMPRRHRPVRATSVASYAHGREHFTGRKGDVLRWLAHHWNATQTSCTSAELATWARAHSEFTGQEWNSFAHSPFAFTLYVRRGLSDLQTVGLVETEKDSDQTPVNRKCAVTGRTCMTWRVTQR